ncbi:dynamin family protein [Paenibacillus xylaniclasticus]|uniref:dynamin family protein n=1 Tax=Paenibacillus xylaniclasticus TaxID=588083 RepID=UPI000FD9349B|nr:MULTISPECIES: dynamin family protein [Paenibacillus]GFN31621.1 hypothetical protein PCURB6_18810 [Paenibacillus curdlanolyticus]
MIDDILDKNGTRYKDELQAWLKRLQHCCEELDLSEYAEAARQLDDEVQRQALRIVVLGEFNNGKSTLVNALIGQQLLPMDVTPTTALIHWIVADEEEERRAEVLYENGEVQLIDATAQALQEWSAQHANESSATSVVGIELHMPMRGIDQGTIIVDTPGLNDLNEQRSDITYRYIPNADVVIVVLHALQPLRATEREYLEETLLKQGLDRILFVLNFADLTDGAEEQVLQAARRRLQSIPGFEQAEPILVSALEGCEARMTDDESLWELCGMASLVQEIQRLSENGSSAELRWTSSIRCAERLLQDVMERLDWKGKAASLDHEQLQSELEELRRWKVGWSERQQLLDGYVEDRTAEIKHMVRKSIRHMFDGLSEDLMEMTDIYQGSDLAKFVSTDVPLTVKRRLKGWIEQYSYRIDELLSKLAEQLSYGLSQSFGGDIRLRPVQIDLSDVRTDAEIKAEKRTDPMVKSGLIVGGASALAVMLGGPIVVPIITLSGLPLVQRTIRERDYQAQKPKLKALIQEQLEQVEQRFTEETLDYVMDCTTRLHRLAVEQFDKQLDSYAAEMEQRMNELQRFAATGDQLSRLFRDAQLQLEQMAGELHRMAAERGAEYERVY